MPKVEGFTEKQIFEVATKFAKEKNRVYIAEALEILLAEAQNKVLETLSTFVLPEEKSFNCLYVGKEKCSYECAYCKAKRK